MFRKGRRSCNPGKTPVRTLRRILASAPVAAGAPVSPSPMNLRLWVQQALTSLAEKPRQIIGQRMGLCGPPMTLARIGTQMGLTRERIRQLEGQGIRNLEADAAWFRTLERDLFQRLAVRSRALSWLGAEELEARLRGAGRHPHIMVYLLQKLGPQRLFLVSVSHVFYLIDMPPVAWHRWLHQSRRQLRSVAWAGWSETRCHAAVMQAKPDTGPATRDLLWQILRDQFSFDGVSASLSLVPTTAEQAVRQILAEIPEPLHVSEFCARANTLLVRKISPKSIQNAVARAGLLLGRGIYGEARHIQVSAADRARVVEAVEARMVRHAPHRQWHASELIAGLQIDLGVVPGLDQYVLDILLRESRRLKRLGRLVWQLDSADATRPARINIQQAVVDILRKTNRPMTADAIYDRLVQKRGVGQYFQVHPDHEVRHLGQNLWGLYEWEAPAPLLALGATARPPK